MMLLLQLWWTALLAVVGLAGVVVPATWARDRLLRARRRSLLHLAARRLRHVAGCRDCLHHHVTARGERLRPVP